MARHAATLSPLNAALEAMLGAMQAAGTVATAVTLATAVPLIATGADLDAEVERAAAVVSEVAA